MSSYYEKLRMPQWLRKRAEILENRDCTCQKCGLKTPVLEVHHRYYVAKRDPWQYPDWALAALCNPCHKEIQDHDVNNFQTWEGIPFNYVPEILTQLCVGILVKLMDLQPEDREPWKMAMPLMVLDYHIAMLKDESEMRVFMDGIKTTLEIITNRREGGHKE